MPNTSYTTRRRLEIWPCSPEETRILAWYVGVFLVYAVLNMVLVPIVERWTR
jgi:hypothetical protein